MPDCIVSDGKALTSGAQIHGALPPGAQIHGAPSSEALRIVVVGMPLSGKTSVYRRLLKENVDGRGFVYELDAEIEKDAGKSIPEIFAEEGEAGFRVREREVLLRFLMPRETAGEVDSYALKTDISGCRSGNGIPKEGAVYKEGIPTAFADRGNELKERTLIVFAGGGAVQSPETRAVLKQYGGIVYLRTSLPTLLLRLNEAETKKRPLFQMDCPIKTLKRLYEIRTKLYEELATYIIDTDGRSITEVSDELMKIVGIGESMNEIIVEARGLSCPIPVVSTIKAIGELKSPGVVETHVDNAVAVENLLLMAKNKGFSASKRTEGDEHFVVRIEVSSAQKSEDATASGASEDVSQYTCSASNETVVAVFPSEFMGSGSDELGAILIKGFIYTLTQIEKRPRKIIFYNSGVKLAVEGPQLEDLKKLEDEGVEIMSCGTCLDYYGLKDRLAVGSVSNMYAIVEALSQATKVLRP